MNDLIEALRILNNYITDEYFRQYPTCCMHDALYVYGAKHVSLADTKRLSELGFTSFDDECWVSKRFGSC